MKTHVEKHSVKMDGVDNVIAFRAEINAKAFKDLSDTIYSNKPLSIIRELAANAYDSHVAANNPNPFDVHLPTALKPQFYIRDYGVGLSPKEIEDVYTVYFKSSKDNDNSQVGCLGLGSKTPFSYFTRTFTVDSWKNGKHYVYECFFNEEGIPCAAPLLEESSNEPTGLKVTFEVSKTDISLFQSEAIKVFFHYKNKPNFINYKLVVPNKDYFLEGNGWGIYKVSSYLHSATIGPKAVMGNIYYPIDKDANSKFDKYNDFFNLNIDIHFPIGELDFTLSREKLSYNPRTINNIANKLKEISQEITSKIESKITNATSLWDARQIVFELEMPAIQSLANNIKWDNKPLLPPNFQWYNKVLDLYGEYGITNSQRFTLNSWNKKAHKSNTKQFNIKAKTEFYEYDLKTGNQSRARYYLEQLQDISLNVCLLEFENKKARDNFIEKIGINPSQLKKTSDLPQPPRQVGKGTARGKRGIVCEYQECSSSVGSWKSVKIDYKQGGVYTELFRYNIMYDGKSNPPQTIKHILDSFGQLNIKIPTIYGVKASEIEKLKQHGAWQNFEDWAKDEIKHVLKTSLPNTKIPEGLAEIVHQNDSLYSNDRRIKTYVSIAKKIVKSDSLFKKEMTTIHNMKCAKISELVQAYQHVFKVNVAALSKNDKDIFEKIEERYPMLALVNTYYYNYPEQKAADYINLVDKEF